MRGRMTYVNHLGKVVDLNCDGVKVNTGKLNDWELGTMSLNGYIYGFKHEIIEKPVVGIVFKHDSEPALRKLDELYEAAIIDTDNDGFDAPPYGRIVIDDWYMLCWLKGAEYDRTWYEDAGDFTMMFTSDIPLWTREIPQTFVVEVDGDDGVDYAHDYPFDFSKSGQAMTVHNASPRKSPVRITVEGPASSWKVRMADNDYILDLDLQPGEHVVIDGRDETVILYDNLGNPSNAFDKIGGKFEEHSGSYIYEPIPAGDSTIVLEGVDAAEVIVYEQRDQRPFAERFAS